jgi:hypothetical protein
VEGEAEPSTAVGTLGPEDEEQNQPCHVLRRGLPFLTELQAGNRGSD